MNKKILGSPPNKKGILAEPLRSLPRDPKPDFGGYAPRRGNNSTINTRDTRTYFSCWNGAQHFFIFFNPVSDFCLRNNHVRRGVDDFIIAIFFLSHAL